MDHEMNRHGPGSVVTSVLQTRKYHAMTKRQLIEDIRQHNPTAQPQFLAQFEDADLQQYLDHLEAAKAKHARKIGWLRPQSRLRAAS